MTNVALNYFGKTGPETITNGNRPVLIDELYNRGAEDVFVTRGAGSYDEAEGTVRDALHVHVTTDGEVVSREIGVLALSAVDVVRTSNYLGLDTVPVINDPRARLLAGSKDLFTQRVGEPLGVQPPTTLIYSENDMPAAFESLRSGPLILKPVGGSLSKGIHTIDANFRHEGYWSRKIADSLKRNKSYILQEKIDITTPFPSGIRGTDQESQESLDLANKELWPKEMRMYWFYSADQPEKTQWYPAARIGGTKQDYLYADDFCTVDPDSIPAELVEMSERIMQEFTRETGVAEVFAAIDCAYGSLLNDPTGDEKWWLVEMNARSPFIVEGGTSESVSRHLNGAYADQIIRLALRGSNTLEA